MENHNTASRHRFTNLERAILVAHGVLAACLGVIGLFSADDPGWGDLQRMVILLLVGLWLAGLLAAALVARRFDHQGARAAVLVLGPPVVLLGFLAVARL